MIKMSSYYRIDNSTTVAALPSIEETYGVYGPYDVYCSFADLPEPDLSKSLIQWNAHNRWDVGIVFASKQGQRPFPWRVRLIGWLP